jgi:hypothetical protein
MAIEGVAEVFQICREVQGGLPGVSDTKSEKTDDHCIRIPFVSNVLGWPIIFGLSESN